MAFEYLNVYVSLSRIFSVISLLIYSLLLPNLSLLTVSAQFNDPRISPEQQQQPSMNNRLDLDSNRNAQVVTSTAFPMESTEFARMRNLAKTKVFNLTVGIVVSDPKIIEDFRKVFKEINSEAPVSSKQTVRLRPIFDPPDLPTKSANPIEAVLKICERFVQQGIGALILRNENSDLMTPVAISYTLSFYQIPIISINDRNNIFSDKSIHSMFMRTVPAYSEQALVMLDIVSHHQWSRIAVLATNDVNGRNFLSNLWPAIQRRNIKVDPYFPFEPGNRMLIKFHLTHLEKSATRVALIYASKEDCLTIADEAAKANMSSSFVWIFNDLIISDMSSTSNSLKLVPPGALIPRLKHAEDTEEHLRDAIRAVKSSYQSMIRKSQIAKFQSMTKQGNKDKNGQTGEAGFSFDYEQKTTTRMPLTDEDLIEVANYGAPAPTPKECGGEGAHWADGHKFLRELKMYKQNPAETGDLAFNSESGDRLNSEYHILNMRTTQPHLIPVGTWTAETGLKIFEDPAIVWPSGSTEKPQGVVVSKHLRIVTAVTEPFVNKIRAFPDGSCTGILENQQDIPKGAKAVPCSLPPYGNRNQTEHWCCYGYCIDLLAKLAGKLKITYDLHLVADGKFGARASKSMPDTGSIMVNPTAESAPGSGGPGGLTEREVWDGTIGEILNGKADLIVAALTIDNERAQVIDFSNPFKHQGLSIVVKKKQPNSSLASFIQPFQYQLWVLIALSVHVVALILYLLDRFSPFGRFKVNHGEGSVEEEDALNLSSAMWFAWGVLLNSGIGEGTPRSFSARVLGVVWAGFAMIIVASYTANLAAFLVLDRPEAEIAGINDARMRNPSDAYKYGTVKDSAVQAYFKRKVEMSNMYRFMLRFSRSSAQEAIEDVRKGDLDAFIWDSAVLDYETSRDCSLITVGEMFHRSGYGIGMAKDSAWKEDISLEILQFHEDGFMETLDNNWMKSKTCDNSDSQPATLGLENMAGVFMLVGGGIVAGVVLIFIEMAYKRHYGKQERQEVVARAAFDRWRSAVKNKSSRGNGDGGVSYVPSTYSMGSNTRPSESKLNQLFGGTGATQSYIPMHTMTPSASQPSDLTLTNDLGSPSHQSSNPPYQHQAPNHSWIGGPAQSNPPTMLRQNHHQQQPNQTNPSQMANASPQAHKNRPGQMHQNYPFSGDHSTTVSNSGVTSPRGMYPTGPLDKETQLNPPNSTSTFGKSRQNKNQPQPAFGNKSAPPNQNNKNSSTLPPHNRPCNNINTNNNTIHNNNNSANPNDSSVSPVTLDLKLFDPDFVREKSSAGRISAKSSRGDLHLT